MPQLTVSGYRGIWGDSLTQDSAARYARAFAAFIKEIHTNPTILIGRDGRESGPEIRTAIIKQFNNLGISYVDGDILPTPTVLFAVRKYGYAGAIIITASHNPIEYNGLKFVTDKALFTDESEVQKIKNHYESDRAIASSASDNSPVIPLPNFAKEHIDQILAHIDVEAIRAQKFHVAVDMINASACMLDPYLFEQLGVTVTAINDIPNGKFPHKPEPLKENLTEIATIVRTSGAHIGFAQDPDADRLVVIDENGIIISEEYTLALGVEQVMSKNHGGIVVINMSTSQMNADIARNYGGTCIRTKVGEANVVAGIQENKAVIGGEGGGGIIYPTINTARDSFVSMALVLELLATRNQTASACVASLPRYEIRKDKMPVAGNLQEVYAKIKSHFTDASVNELDGLRLDFPDSSWIHLRPSNTEPIIRLIGEAKEKERLDALFEETKSII